MLVAISVDDVAPGKALREKLGLTFPVLSDPGGAAAIRRYGVFDPDTEIAWPSIFVVSKDGIVLQRWLADTYRERIATADVLAQLDQLP